MAKTRKTVDLPKMDATPTIKESAQATPRDNGRASFKISKLEHELQTFFAYLTRVSPAVFGLVTPEFIHTAVENFEEAENLHRAKVAADEQARQNAFEENKKIRQAENDARRNAHLDRIETARKKTEQDQTALLNAQEELRQKQTLQQNPK